MCHLFPELKFGTSNSVPWVLWISNGCKKMISAETDFSISVMNYSTEQKRIFLKDKSWSRSTHSSINPSSHWRSLEWFCENFSCVSRMRERMCLLQGLLLSNLCPSLFRTACMGGIIGMLNNLKTVRAHYHKYSLDVLLRSTVRPRALIWLQDILSVCMCVWTCIGCSRADWWTVCSNKMASCQSI